MTTRLIPLSSNQINGILSRDLSNFLIGHAQSDDINPIVFCSSRAFRSNIETLSRHFQLSSSRLIYSPKALPVEKLIITSIENELRLLFYGPPALYEFHKSPQWDAIVTHSIVGETILDEKDAKYLLETGIRCFMITRLDAVYTLYETYKTIFGYDTQPLSLYLLCGATNLEGHWFNKNVIPLSEFSTIAEKLKSMEKTSNISFNGVFVYSGNPFNHNTRSAIQNELLTPHNLRLLHNLDVVWGGLGKFRDHDAELRELLLDTPSLRHHLVLGTALAYNSGVVVTKVRHLHYPLLIDSNRITIEWGISLGAHDIKYTYSNSFAQVLLANKEGVILEPSSNQNNWAEVIIDGCSMSSDDNNLGILHLPANINVSDINYIIFMDSEYTHSFVFKHQFFGGNLELRTKFY